MNYNKLFLLVLFAASILMSCEDVDIIEELPDESTAPYANGIFILNEGNFGSGNSSVSFLDSATDEVQNNIFSGSNPEKMLGDTGQSIAKNDDLIYMVLNVSNKIEVVNAVTFKTVGTIETGLNSPRYISFANGNAYVTNWGDGFNVEDDFIAVYRLSDLSLITKISVPEGPEEIIENNGSLYVSHTGGYGFGNTISVIDSNSNKLIETIQVGDLPKSMAIMDGSLWILCSGLPNYASEETAGEIIKISLSNNEIVSAMKFANATDHPSNLKIDGNLVYYTLGKSLFGFATNGTELPTSAFIEMSEVDVLYGLEIIDNTGYVTSATKDFTSNGSLLIYNLLTGNFVQSYSVGINPNAVLLNN